MFQEVVLIVLISIFNNIAASEKIVGGTAAAEGEIPWQVAINFFGSLSCGGSIISDKFIVTAAHCSDFPPGVYNVISGTIRASNGGKSHNVTNIIIHEEWNSLTFEHNIAVWEVTPPFEWDAMTSPVGLLEQDFETPDGTLITVSGWGTTSVGGLNSNVLLKVEMPIVPAADCNSAYANFGGIFPDQICAGFPEGGADACEGDSGGPLFLENNLHGISSWGNGCASPGFPGIYTKASAYREWIRQNTGV